MRLNFITLFLLLHWQPILGAKNTIDSLKQVISRTTDDSIKAITLNKLSFEYRSSKPDLCIEYANQAITLAINIESKYILTRAYSNRGIGYRNQNKIDDALKDFDTAEKIAKEINDQKQLASIYNAYANLYNNTAKYSMAIEYHNKAVYLRRESNDSSGLALSLANRANVYTKLGNYNQAAEDLFSAIDMMKKLNDIAGLGLAYNSLGNIYLSKKTTVKKALENYLTALNYMDRAGDEKGRNTELINIGSCHLLMKDFAMARSFYNQAKHFSELTDDKKSLALCLSNMGSLELEAENIAAALNYFSQSIDLYRVLKNLSGQAIVHKELFRLYMKKNDFAVAESELNIAIDLYKETGQLSDLNDLYSLASDEFLLMAQKSNKKEFVEKSIKYYKLELVLSDSLSKLEEQKSIEELRAAYDLKKSEDELKSKEKELELQSSRIEKQKQFIYSLVISSVLFVALLFFIYRSNKRSKAANLALTKAYSQIEEKNKSISDSINYAKRIQEAILVPETDIVKSFTDAFVIYMPKDVVSGYFYWYGESQEWKLIVAADCTGHGVPGGFMCMLGSEILQEIIFNEQVNSAQKALSLMDKRVTDALNKSSKSYRDGMDMALCAINIKTGKINFAGANRPLILIRNGELKEFSPNKLNIGGAIDGQEKIFNDEFYDYKKGDTIYLFTDGYADQFGGEKGKKFMTKKLKELLVANYEKPMAEQKQILANTYNNWKGNLEQVDDVCVIGIRI
jgi:serine phosphatase RsbU (regulator of sigma subunit)